MTVTRTLKLVGLLIGVLGVACVCAVVFRSPTRAAARIEFLQFTHSTSGVQVARFRMENQSSRGIARSAYCRIDGVMVDISPKRLPPGESELFDVPLVSHSGVPVHLSGNSNLVQFHGVRALSVTEDIRDALDEFFRGMGIRWSLLEVNNGWEIVCIVPAGSPPKKE